MSQQTQLNSADLIFVSVVGVNGTTRKTKTVSQFFNGGGQPVDSNGQPTNIGIAPLKGLSGLSGVNLPPFNADTYQALVKTGATTAAAAMLESHMAAVQAAKSTGSIEVALLDRVYEWLCQQHGFRSDDGDWFVLKREDLDVVVDQLPSQADRSLYTISATAVFGA